jgi:hypothetical protein
MRILSGSPGRIESNSLLGCWKLVRSEESSFEPAEADFRSDGRLYYSTLSGEKWQIMKLVYRIEGNILITDQPSSPRKEHTSFHFEEDGTLVLQFGGKKSWFKRSPKVALEV